MPRLRAVDQTAMDERVIQDDALLTALESWFNARSESQATGRVARDAKKEAVRLLDEAGIGAGDPVRIGRFRIERKLVLGGTKEVTYSDSETIELELVD